MISSSPKVCSSFVGLISLAFHSNTPCSKCSQNGGRFILIKISDKQACKARLVARGFQERDVGNIRKDSPTCSKEGLCITLASMASNHWKCKSMDIKTAFLLIKELDRLVYLDPPKEANVLPGYIWKFSKCVYGLTDASRSWYLTLREELLKSGAVVSKYDQAIFTCYFGIKLHGLIATHVNDFCFAGSEIFQTRLCYSFKIKSEEVWVPMHRIEHKGEQG